GGADPARVAEPLAGIMDVAIERHLVDKQKVNAEADRRASQAKTAVLHLVSHDLRPMVHAVADTLATSPDDSEEGRRLQLAAQRAARLVDDLVDLSRLEAGTLRTQPEPVDLNAVVAAASEHAEHPITVALPADL